MMETTETTQDPLEENDDILDSTAFGIKAKLFDCQICQQKFTNKVNIYFLFSLKISLTNPLSLQLKITLHW